MLKEEDRKELVCLSDAEEQYHTRQLDFSARGWWYLCR